MNNRPKTRKKRPSRTVLKYIYKLGNAIPMRLLLNRRAMYEYAKNGELSDKAVRDTTFFLTTKKYIRLKNDINNDKLIELTHFGMKKVLEYDYDELVIPVSKKWDEMWRIVVFDISEKKKNIRHRVNIKLRELGFVSLQKSTFIYPYECRREIEFIKNHFYLTKEINYILAEEIDNDTEMRNIFGLSL